MMNETVVLALLGVVGTLLGSWLGAFISRKSANDLLTRQAKMDFSNSFTDVLLKLHTVPSDELEFPVDLLKAMYPVHFASYLRLRLVLDDNERLRLDSKWSQYTKDDGYELLEEKDQYRFSHLYSLTDNEQRRMLAIKLVGELIQI